MFSRKLLLRIVYKIMTSRSTRNSQEAAFDAEIRPPLTEQNGSTPPPPVVPDPPSTSQAAQPPDQPSPAFLASVISAVRQALAAEQASIQPAMPPSSSSTNVPEAPVPGGVPPSSLSGQLDAQVSALAASGVGFPSASAVAASASAQGRPNFVVPSFISTFAPPIPALGTSSSHTTIGTVSLALGGVSSLAQPPLLHQPFVVGPGFSPIPAKLVSQIVAGKFVELNELLSVNIVSTECEPQLLFDGRLVLTSTPKKPKWRIEDISSWLEAFAVYSLILSSHFPQRWRDLLQYQLLILRTHRQFAGRVWLAYDRAFREHAAATNLTDWSAINVQLFNFHAAGASARSGRDMSDDSTEPQGASSSNIICKSWNRGRCVAPSSSCRFAHKCSSCFGPHRVGTCPGEPPSQSPPKRPADSPPSRSNSKSRR